MNNRKVMIKNNNSALRYALLSGKLFLLNLFLIVLFPLIIYLLGYEKFWNINIIIIMILLFVSLIEFVVALIFWILSSKREIVLQENDKILLWKAPKNIDITTSGQVNIGNIIFQNSNDAFSSVIGAILATNGVKEAYDSMKEYRDLGKITNYELKDLLKNPYLNYKYYENCKIIKDTNSFTLYSGNMLKKDGTFSQINFKIKKDYYNKNIKSLNIFLNLLIYVLIIILSILNINNNMTKESNFLNDINVKLNEFQIEKVNNIGNTNYYESSDFDINISYKIDSIKDFSVTTTNTDLGRIREIAEIIYNDEETINWYITNITTNLNNLMATKTEQFSEWKSTKFYYNTRIYYNEQNRIEIYFSAKIY